MHIINNKVLKIISKFFLFHIRKILFFLSLKYLNQFFFYFFCVNLNYILILTLKK
jgi:hypothetical protein